MDRKTFVVILATLGSIGLWSWIFATIVLEVVRW